MIDEKNTSSPHRYRQVAEALTASIRGGEYAPQALLPTFAELGNRFEVSQITVRHAVRLLVQAGLVTTVPGKGTVVRGDTAAHPDRKERRIGLLLQSLAGSWHRFVPAIHEAAGLAGADLLIRPLPMDADYRAQPQGALIELSLLRDNCGCGLVMFGDRFLAEAFLKVRRPDEAAVCLENSNGVPEGVGVVSTDNFGGTFRLTRELISLGHRRIAYRGALHGDGTDGGRWQPGTTHYERHAGYLAALETEGLDPFPNTKVVRDFTDGERWDPAALLQDGPTAFVCFNDHQAFRLWRRLGEAGLSAPEHISLTGYDNLRPPDWLPAAARLSTLDQSFEQLAAECVSLLHSERRRLREGSALRAPLVLVPPVPCPGTSIGPPRC